MNTQDQNTNDVIDAEPTVEADVSELITKLLAVMREQEARISRQDELLLEMQREISMLGQAVNGHQKIKEASQPQATPPGPPKPPTIVH